MNRRAILLMVLLFVFISGGLLFLSLPSGENSLRFTQDKTVTDEMDTSEESENPSPSVPDREPSSVFIEILPSDCANECTAFTHESEKFRYCQSVCGFSPAETGTSTKTNPYQKSIEQRDAAIKNKDLSACSDISDTNLRKSCEVRVTEDMLE